MARAYELYNYKVRVTKHVDGDTFHGDMDLGVWTHSDQIFRLMTEDLKGVQCPELRAKDPAERERAKAAAARTAGLIPLGTTIIVHTEKGDDWRRLLACVRLPDGRDLGGLLIAEGLAVPYVRK